MRISTLEHWQAFGQTIKDGRVARGWPMRTFARMVGISHCYLCNLELAKVPPPSDAVLLKMAECLEIPYQTLFARAGRLPSDVLRALWQHPAMPAILSTLPGMSLDEAQTFCRQVIASLPQSTPA